MMEIAKGNILEADAEALVNTVNCVGFMGPGIALQFKQAFPDNFKAHEAACHAGQVAPGRMFIHDNNRLINPRYIINFPTKRHWRGKSRLADIRSGLKALVADVRRLGVRSIAVPPLGCGLGGLDWGKVRPMIEQAFSELPDVRVLLFEPIGTPNAKAMPDAEARRRELAYHEELYSGFARQHFAKPAVRAFRAHLVKRILRRTGPGPRARLLSLSCGIGDTELLLAPAVGHIVGADFSPAAIR